ncbi:MAG: tRNA 2-thiouridine(34) synthase MnmA [Bifidobacteriaceae bacterium]|jgi:tRNA-specific 2-thiouridylase|nr:tRNA 2-thiouridine(34) synthase MnmA [Bifidobacteriaceae bacterium]
MKLLAALSGGVDSAVAAALAVEKGHDVTAVHMALMRNRELARSGSRGCCSIEDSNDAAVVASKLNIPFYVWDLSEEFQKKVIKDFVNEYRFGRTPNPCVRCNEFIKFQTLLERSLTLGFDGIITGHWAKIISGNLYRAKNISKDQSYVLAVMGKKVIEKCYFPLGDFLSKDDVRKKAKDLEFEVKDKPESTDICFIQKGKTGEFLSSHLGEQSGNILDNDGKILAKHKGYFHYTIGQRKGLNIKNPNSDGSPRYVIKIKPEDNEVIVGSKNDLDTKIIYAKLDSWHDDKIIQKQGNIFQNPIKIQIRAHSEPILVQAEICDQKSLEENYFKKGQIWKFILDSLQKNGVANGQTLVVYKTDKYGEKVLGSWTIVNSEQF